MKSPVAKRSIQIAGRKTSVSLEEVFWAGIKAIADERQITLFNLVEEIDAARRPHSNLASALRTHVLDHYKRKSLGSESARSWEMRTKNAFQSLHVRSVLGLVFTPPI